MSNLMLYRKYRPKEWDEVMGQEHVVRTLTNALKLGRIGHGYLFSGPRGTGKTTVARLLAKSLNCADLDLIEIDAASNRGIDEIRELREGVKFAPTGGPYKVYIIDEVHQLTREAFNALLKTLEEPPRHAVFVLATTEPAKVPDTIVSRVQVFNFKKLSAALIAKKLQMIAEAEKIKIDDAAVNLIASYAGGSYRDAEVMLEQLKIWSGGRTVKKEDVEELLGAVDFEKVKAVAGYISSGDAKTAVNYVGELCESGTDLQEFLKALISHLRKIMLIKIDASLANLMAGELTEEQIETVKKQSETFALADVSRALQILLNASNDMKRTPIPSLPIELALVEIIQILLAK